MGNMTLTGRGRRRLMRGHPWVYADDVAAGESQPGELVPVSAPDGKVLGWGLFSSHSKISVRLVTRSKRQPDREFWARRVGSAVEARRSLGYLDPKGACRLLAGDADGVPGLVVDHYGGTLVLQSGCQASDRMRDFLLELIEEALPFEPSGILERSDSSARKHEDLEPKVGWIRGEEREVVEVEESESAPGRGGTVPGLRYEVALLTGHKTGHYLDQRENRIAAARHAQGGDVLDAFCYDGLFGIRAALAGAKSVLCIDQSATAGERCLRNAERNGVADRVRFVRANAMHDLRTRSMEKEVYDLVIVDPPAFAKRKQEIEGATRGYRELNRRAMSLLRPGGVLVSVSCSHNVDRELFHRTLAQAALAGSREARLIESLGAAPDHPVLLSLPESEYLKCAVMRIDA